MCLCEYVMDLAVEEAEKHLYLDDISYIEKLAEEILQTAEEYEPETNHP